MSLPTDAYTKEVKSKCPTSMFKFQPIVNFANGSPIFVLSFASILPSPLISTNLISPGCAPVCLGAAATSAAFWNKPAVL